MQNLPIKAVFFDLDGTLLDSAPDFFIAMHRLQDEHQKPRVDEELIRETVSNGARALTTLASGLTEGDAAFDQYHQRLLALYSEEAGKNCRLFKGMQRLVKFLKREPLFWGIATNKPSRFTDKIYQDAQLSLLLGEPDTVVCPDHVSQAKPDPEMLLLACQQVGCQPYEVVYIGDHKRDIDCGIAAGTKTVAVSYGYIDDNTDLETWNADYIADSADDIWTYIQTLLTPTEHA